MSWNENIPSGNEILSYGDDRIRQLKEDIETIFKNDHYFPIDVNNPKCVHKWNIVNFDNEETRNNRIYFFRPNKSLKYIVDLNSPRLIFRDLLPKGTKVLFLNMPEQGRQYWSIVYTQTNDYVVCLDNLNAGSFAGSNSFFSQIHTHNCNNANTEQHYHTVKFGQFSGNQGSGIKESIAGTSGTKWVDFDHYHNAFNVNVTTFSSVSHNHNIEPKEFTPKYVNAIILERIK